MLATFLQGSFFFNFLRSKTMKFNPNIFIHNAGDLDIVPDLAKHDFNSLDFSNYCQVLSNIYCNRFVWSSPYVEAHHLQLIEYDLLRYGETAVYRPYIKTKKGIKIKANKWQVSPFSVADWNDAKTKPKIININRPENNKEQRLIEEPDFIIIKDKANILMPNAPITALISNFANRLALIDAVIEQHLQKQRMPLLLTGMPEQRNTAKAYIKEAFRGAVAFFQGSGFDKNQAINLKSQEIPYIINDLISSKNQLMQEYCSLIGIINSQDYSQAGIYQNKDAIKLNSTFTFNVAQSHYISRQTSLQNERATILQLKCLQADLVYKYYNNTLGDGDNDDLH